MEPTASIAKKIFFGMYFFLLFFFFLFMFSFLMIEKIYMFFHDLVKYFASFEQRRPHNCLLKE